MNRFDDCLLHDILNCVPASSSQHSLVLTTWLLAMKPTEHCYQGMFDCFIHEIEAGRWKINKSLIRYLIRHGDSDTRFHLLCCSLEQFLTNDEREKLFLAVFNAQKNDAWSMEILSDLMRGFLESQHHRANHFRVQIDYFV